MYSLSQGLKFKNISRTLRKDQIYGGNPGWGKILSLQVNVFSLVSSQDLEREYFLVGSLQEVRYRVRSSTEYIISKDF